MHDRVIRLALETVETIDRLCQDPTTSDEDFERLLDVLTPLHSEALSAQLFPMPERLAAVERLTRWAERVVEDVRRETTRG